ncbi:hypothetical protein B0188_00485 [[Haemophilus] felis]|uniref:DUF2572 domain-containing protein n=1 Tax=[Haemophilus] felis TaxID=123822 RepID=A0A1T0BBL4_9PAST|nr:hypothetical protein B0188_00485 [[Haemophilus] felis]
MRLHKGIMTVTVLLLLSSVLLLTMLLNADILYFYSSLSSQRLQYVKMSLDAQQKSLKEHANACQRLSLSSGEHLVKFPIRSNYSEFSHYIWCRHIHLFKKMPNKPSYTGEFNQIIDSKMSNFFRAKINLNNQDTPYYFYWFEQSEQVWELSKDINGVIIATGNLSIRGKGNINGTIITAGRLELDNNIKLNYQEDAVKYWYDNLSYWQEEENSWYDFNGVQ